MNEIDFLRGIEGEKQQGSDLISGAEHLVRLRIQTGQSQELYPDLELEKQAGELTESLNTPPIKCKDCGKIKTACMCGYKTASANILKQALRDKLASDWSKGMLATTTGLGALAGGVGTYLASRPQKDTGKSKSEEELEGMVASQKNKPENGLLHKLKNREVENAHGFSRAFREHPIKASLIGTGIGALAGHSIGQLAGAAAKHGAK